MPHGNSHQNQNDYHLYEIKDLQEDEPFKYGISDEPIGQDGLSKRMRVQLYILNLGAAWIRYAAQILLTGIPGRKKAEEIEDENIEAFKEAHGRRPRGNPPKGKRG